MVEVVVLAGSSVVTALLAVRTAWGLNRYAYRPTKADETNLPSVSVCIAARNEVHALSNCLERVLQSDYQKLEILVLDDSSKDDTPHIIKSFAHSGIRFIAGRDIPPGWLGKNHATQTLALEASGDYLLFLDVDAVLRTHTISQLVAQLRANGRSMVSVLPRREDSGRASAVFGTLRYYWSLVLATKHTPPSASTLWMIKRDTLLELERGLPDYGWSVRPEAHIARQLQNNRDYYYLIGTPELGVSVEKRWSSQLQTAQRLYYPIAGHSWWRALVATLALTLLIAPLALLPFIATTGLVIWCTILIGISFFGFAVFMIRTSSPKGWLLRLIVWPYILVQELTLLLISMFRYATRTVQWKGRPVQATPNNRTHLTINE
jgi:hypothetical protein